MIQFHERSLKRFSAHKDFLDGFVQPKSFDFSVPKDDLLGPDQV